MQAIKFYRSILAFLICIFLLLSCRKDELVPNNTPPFYDEIPTVLVENYVNRVFIDLIGREPLDIEMEVEVKYLQDNDLGMIYRDSLITKLMTDMSLDTTIGDSTTIYKVAYYHRMYDMSKARLLEGVSNEQIHDEFMNNMENAIFEDSMQYLMTGEHNVEIENTKWKLSQLKKIISSEKEYMNGEIEINEMLGRMLYNAVYDQINMNTFNFVNASFDDLFFRFPTAEEFDNAYNMIEKNESRLIFNIPGLNKLDYIDILTNSREFYEGMITWVYLAFIAREPTSLEKGEIMETFFYDYNLQNVQKKVMMTDEYAHFD